MFLVSIVRRRSIACFCSLLLGVVFVCAVFRRKSVLLCHVREADVAMHLGNAGKSEVQRVICGECGDSLT